jgi:hypothetical protein
VPYKQLIKIFYQKKEKYVVQIYLPTLGIEYLEFMKTVYEMLISLLWDMDSTLSFGLFQQVLYKVS